MSLSATTKKISRRTASGDDKRGNSRDRLARKLWMLRTWGDGTKCPCVHCDAVLNLESLQADRIAPGGSYRRANVQPSCAGCNRERSNKTDWVPPKLRPFFAV